VAFCRHLADRLDGRHEPSEALDGSAVPTRDAKRRGAGWLPGRAASGWSNRLGWDEGLHRLMAVTPRGLMTGFGGGPASAKDHPLAETFLALRQRPPPGCLRVGQPALGPSVGAQGFEGQPAHTRWWQRDRAPGLCPPKRHSQQPWSTRLRRWLAGARQIVETVDDKIHQTVRLSRERPHDLSGFQARLAAKMALHNSCIWLNEQLGRQPLAFADLRDWEDDCISHQTFRGCLETGTLGVEGFST